MFTTFLPPQGEIFVNDGKCRIVQRHLIFNVGIAYGIDCLLTPPSLGGRCDTQTTFDLQVIPRIPFSPVPSGLKSNGSHFDFCSSSVVDELRTVHLHGRSLSKGIQAEGKYHHQLPWRPDLPGRTLFLMLCCLQEIQSCDLPTMFVTKNAGCRSVCTANVWLPKCCSGYYGRDCQGETTHKPSKRSNVFIEHES